VLGEPSASVVMLDEPAVALHSSLQRQLGAHLVSAPAQFLVITHSAELLPLADATDVRLIRLDRDDKSATRAWAVDEACRVKLGRKLVAKGNERLPFAWRAILCEGQDDVEALITLTERMGIDLRRRNIAVTDCGSRDNLPDYVWFCAELGLKYLAVMDADSATPDALPKAQAVRDAVNLRHGGELAEFPVSLEATFGVIKQRPSLVPAVIRALPFAGDMPDPAQAPPEVVALAEAIRRLTK
jgi:predicted ATP-dependent endonuclease of OLD family